MCLIIIREFLKIAFSVKIEVLLSTLETAVWQFVFIFMSIFSFIMVHKPL